MRKESILKVIAFLFVLSAASLSVYARPAELPEWAVSLDKGEYLGISYPGGGQRQAEVFALWAMLQSPDFERQEDVEVVKNVKNICLEYDVKETALLSTGETVVLLTAGKSRSDSVKTDTQSLFSKYESYKVGKFETAMLVSGKIMLYVCVTATNGDKSLFCRYVDSDARVVRYWIRENGELHSDGYEETGVSRYRNTGGVPESNCRRLEELDIRSCYLSECMWFVYAQHLRFPFSALTVRNGKLTLYSRRNTPPSTRF